MPMGQGVHPAFKPKPAQNKNKVEKYRKVSELDQEKFAWEMAQPGAVEAAEAQDKRAQMLRAQNKKK